MDYESIQEVARNTIRYIEDFICPGITVKDVVDAAEKFMLDSGIDSFWYHDIGAFVFSGENTSVSMSGRDYIPSTNEIKQTDILTIDLSPQWKNLWGDYARTIIIESGFVKRSLEAIESDEFKDGILTEKILHQKLVEVSHPDMTFEFLYQIMNEYIIDSGYVNLDFCGNLGHSIETSKDNRIYIEQGNKRTLSSVDYFTFEPHIQKKFSKYGFKKENIYYFKGSTLLEL